MRGASRRAGGMRGASRRAGGMRVALTIVVAGLAVLAEPVSGATESLKDYKGTVTTSYAELPNDQKNYIADDKVENAAAIFADAADGADNPWVQIDFGEGEAKTIGDVDVYGNLETQQTRFSCMLSQTTLICSPRLFPAISSCFSF